MTTAEGGEVEVPRALAGVRLDRALSLLLGISRAAATRLVAEGGVTRAGRPLTDRSLPLEAGEVIVVDDALVPAGGSPKRSAVSPEDLPLEIVHLDDDLVVVDKPAGLVVHPGAGQARGTLVAGLVARFPEIAALATEEGASPERPGIVQRLDKDTSGLLVVARSPRAYRALVSQLSARSVERAYLALVLGSPTAERGVVDAPIGRSEEDATRMAVSPRGREARTHYEVRERFTEPLEASLLELRLETGRTHQIRVHLAAIGHPLLGDSRYGGSRGALPLGRPMLHAARLGFVHPASGERVRFASEPPEDFTAARRRLS